MSYLRTSTNIFEVIDENELVYKIIGASRDIKHTYSRTKKLGGEVGNTITDLIKTGDLLIIEDRTSKYPYSTFPLIYNKERPFAYDCAIYSLKEMYIKDPKGDYVFVAKKNNEGGLELV